MRRLYICLIWLALLVPSVASAASTPTPVNNFRNYSTLQQLGAGPENTLLYKGRQIVAGGGGGSVTVQNLNFLAGDNMTITGDDDTKTLTFGVYSSPTFKGPWIDVRAFADGQSGRPTLAQWQSRTEAQTTAVFQAMIDSVPVGGGGDFGLPADTYVTGPLVVDQRTVRFHRIGGVPGGTASQPIFAAKAIIKLAPGAVDHHITVTAYSSSLLEIGEGVELNGDKANQSYASHGIYCPPADTYTHSCASVNGGVVTNYKGDGIHVEAYRGNLWVYNRSFITNSDGYNIYIKKATDARIWQSDIGFAGLSNIRIDGGLDTGAENIRIGLNDLYSPGQLGDLSDAANVYIGNLVRSVYLTGNDYITAPTYGVYAKENSITNAIVDIIGGRFSMNSKATDNTYSDVYAGHTGVSLTGTSHQNPYAAGAGNVVKYLVQVSDTITGGSTEHIGLNNLIYDSTSYRASAVNYPTWADNHSRDKHYFGRDNILEFNQTDGTKSVMRSYGPAQSFFDLLASGKIQVGDGTNAPDVSLSRLSAGIWGLGGSIQSNELNTFQSKSANGTIVHWWADDQGRLRTKFGAAPSNRNSDGSPIPRNAYTNLTSQTSGAIALDSWYNVGNIAPTGDITFAAPTDGVAGDRLTLVISTNGTAYTITFGSNFVSQGTLSTGTVASKKISITFICNNGTTWIETGRTTVM